MENFDEVNRPERYNKGSVEAIVAIEHATRYKHGIEAVCVANIIKYLWRYEDKGGRQDIEKCQWYMNKLIESYKPNRLKKVTLFFVPWFRDDGILMDSLWSATIDKIDQIDRIRVRQVINLLWDYEKVGGIKDIKLASEYLNSINYGRNSI
jgi:hypothetical protein